MYLPDKDDYSKYWACDIEGDGLPSNRVWCATAVNVGTKETLRMRSRWEIREWFADRKGEGHRFVFHNGIGFDYPTLNRVVGTDLTIDDIIDTMVMSMMYSPSQEGGHSLDNWGGKLNFPKGDFSDWSKWSQEMEDYCVNDSELCRRIFIGLCTRMKKLGFTDLSLEIEHKSWYLIQKQKENGFTFNVKEAHILYSKLREIELEIERKIHERWPPQLKLVRTFAKAYKLDGSYSAGYERHRDEYVKLRIMDGGRYEAYAYESFAVGSPKQRVEKLLEAGWNPREFTKPSETHPKGQPQATIKGQLSPSLLEFVENGGPEEVRLIAQWLDYNSRANMINTWIEAYNDDTHCIHGSLWLANTLRYKHSNPNTANIPAVRVDENDQPKRGAEGVYTYESRALWTVRDTRRRCLVGVDAKGIQLRVLAHYLNNGAFTDAVLTGDPHSYNQEIGGFGSRSIAKTFIYAFLLGAGDAKIGQIIGGSTKDGREIKTRFVSNFPGLKSLLDSLEREVDRTGRIKLCDGTRLIVTHPHTRLGYLLQGDENRLMKLASVYTHEEIVRRELDILKVGDIHDEWQNDCLNEHSDEFALDVCPMSFAKSADTLKYRIPIECSTKIGLNWAETH